MTRHFPKNDVMLKNYGVMAGFSEFACAYVA